MNNTMTKVEADSGSSYSSEGQEGGSGMVIRSSLATITTGANATTGEMNATQMARFQTALLRCAQQFKALGAWAKDKIDEFMETLNLPDLFAKFQELHPLTKTLVVIAILGFAYLLRNLAWEGVAFVWSYVMEFVNSDTGKGILSSATDYLEFMGQNPLVTSFISQFAGAAAVTGNDDSEANPSANLDLQVETSLEVMGSPQQINIMTAFFNYLQSHAMPRSS